MLPRNHSSLPLPWWHRAPLGFLHGTNVYAGLVKSARPVGDIIVSALDINKWDNILRLSCKHDDDIGVIASLMEAVLPLNIALAETVTTETGKEHHATLFCEDKGTEKVKNAIPRIKELLKQRGFQDINLDPYLSPTRLPILRSCPAHIDNGWLRGIDFLKWIKECHKDESQRRLVDLTRAVVSADTENRILRYVFPYRGAKTVRITHSDIPGALRVIFQAFSDCKLNVLSSLLRRGGQQTGVAELLAVCEPRGVDDHDQVYLDLRRRIDSIDQKFNPALRISNGSRANNVIYAPHPHQRMPRGKHPIFFSSWQVACDDRAERLTNLARVVLAQHGCWPLEMSADPEAEGGRFYQAVSLMERAKAGVILVTGASRDRPATFDVDLAHEFGFLQALYKPVLLLTEFGLGTSFQRWAHGRQITLAQFAPDDNAFNVDQPGSVDAMLANWLRKIL